MTLDQITSRLREALLRAPKPDNSITVRSGNNYTAGKIDCYVVALAPLVLSLLEDETRQLREANQRLLDQRSATIDEMQAAVQRAEQAEVETQALREALAQPCACCREEGCVSKTPGLCRCDKP